MKITYRTLALIAFKDETPSYDSSYQGRAIKCQPESANLSERAIRNIWANYFLEKYFPSIATSKPRSITIACTTFSFLMKLRRTKRAGTS